MVRPWSTCLIPDFHVSVPHRCSTSVSVKNKPMVLSLLFSFLMILAINMLADLHMTSKSYEAALQVNLLHFHLKRNVKCLLLHRVYVFVLVPSCRLFLSTAMPRKKSHPKALNNHLWLHSHFLWVQLVIWIQQIHSLTVKNLKPTWSYQMTCLLIYVSRLLCVSFIYEICIPLR